MGKTKRVLTSMGSAIVALIVPMAAFAAVPTMVTPAFSSGGVVAFWETVSSIIQFPFSIFSEANNLYMIGGIVILAIAIGVAILFRRRMHL